MRTHIEALIKDLHRWGSAHGQPPHPFADWAADALVAAMVLNRPATAWRLPGGYYAHLTDWPRTRGEQQKLAEAMERLVNWTED